MDETESSINGMSEIYESEMASEEDDLDENRQSVYAGG